MAQDVAASERIQNLIDGLSDEDCHALYLALKQKYAGKPEDAPDVESEPAVPPQEQSHDYDMVA